MPFPPGVTTEALVRSRRCCCVCHKFAGIHTNVHHIKQEADGGPNILDNAIVLCLNCHADVGHYNDRHPLGNKYHPAEVKRHRDWWWDWCRTNPHEPLPHDPIHVSPLTVRVKADGWETATPIVITNSAPCVLYNVWVKFALGGTGLLGDQLSVSRPCNSTIKYRMGKPDSNTTWFADSVWVSGLDRERYEAGFLVMHRINPGANVEVILKTSKVRKGQGGYVKVSVVHHTPEPTPGPMKNEKGVVQLAFQIPKVDGKECSPVPVIKTMAIAFDGDCPVHGKDCPNRDL